MKWSIPAKTFFLGEYVAINGGPALVLTTEPCFEFTITREPGLTGIHPSSPAGLLWQESGFDNGLHFFDPYHGKGGLGASSAQFVGTYLAIQHLQDTTPCKTQMLEYYYRHAWSGSGSKPSGYDVIAQSLQGCAYVNGHQRQFKIYPWPFQDIGFLLLHTKQKLATHHHLQTLNMPAEIKKLAFWVESAQLGFETEDSQRLIDAVNQYHKQLSHLNLVAPHTQRYIQTFQKNPNILASKGCGAMGSDVILLLLLKENLYKFSNQLTHEGWDILASSDDIYFENRGYENNRIQRLEISA